MYTENQMERQSFRYRGFAMHLNKTDAVL